MGCLLPVPFTLSFLQKLFPEGNNAIGIVGIMSILRTKIEIDSQSTPYNVHEYLLKYYLP